MITISYPSGSISGDTVFDIEERISRMSDSEQGTPVWQWDEARGVWQRFDGATTDLYGPDEYPLRIKDLTRFLAYILDDDTISVRDIKVEVSLEDDERPFPWEVLAYRENIGLGRAQLARALKARGPKLVEAWETGATKPGPWVGDGIEEIARKHEKAARDLQAAIYATEGDTVAVVCPPADSFPPDSAWGAYEWLNLCARVIGGPKRGVRIVRNIEQAEERGWPLVNVAHILNRDYSKPNNKPEN